MGQTEASKLTIADTGPLLRLSELSAWDLLVPFRPVYTCQLVLAECGWGRICPEAANEHLAALEQSSLWVSQRVLAEARKFLKELNLE